ncbi:MAG: Fic family protein [Acidobacteriaceae bacterium]|nr:Fic family protein [Acidobacteriaceae bacterium]MBV9294727.1 Fic family protein [Acidobacteriaceae bacterium]MBV9763324.1 Fic family protein [Acidobacteriaceae bacterium]
MGRYVTCRIPQESYRAYIPPPLPPNPPVDLSGLESLLERANQALGRLDGIALVIPDPDLFLYMYVRKEALLSSQIEGTQSSLSDLLLFESDEVPGVPLDDVREVSRYVAAMSHGLQRLREEFPLSLRLIREIHDVLMRGGRGGYQTPGEFRTSQNWIGGSRPGNAVFVPPPPNQELDQCLADFERFLHSEKPRLPVLVKAALMHVQFETIHPFLDGNGRLGRLLITFLLCAEGVLRDPGLYLSLYLKQNRQRYYDLLQQVRLEGNWETWIEFFLRGVEETATEAVETARQIVALLASDRKRIEALGRPATSVLLVFHLLHRRPILSISHASKSLNLSVPTVSKAIKHLVDLGILKETTGRQKGRLFAYEKYIGILGHGTEPLRR